MPSRYFLVFPIILLSFDQPRLAKVKVVPGMTVSIPRDWRPMDDLDFSERYPSVRAPLAAYTNDERTVDFSINISATRWRPGDEELAKQFFKASLRNMFDRLEIFREGVREVRGKKYVFFEFESRVNGTRENEALRSPVLKYSFIQYQISPDRTLVFTFNCPARLRDDWQHVADLMMRSVKMK